MSFLLLSCSDELPSEQSESQPWSFDDVHLDYPYLLVVELYSEDQTIAENEVIRWEDNGGIVTAPGPAGRIRLIRGFETWEETRDLQLSYVIEVDGEEIARQEVTTASCHFLYEAGLHFEEQKVVFVHHTFYYDPDNERVYLGGANPRVHCAAGLDYVWFRPQYRELELNLRLPFTPVVFSVEGADYKLEEVRFLPGRWSAELNYRVVVRWPKDQAELASLQAILRLTVLENESEFSGPVEDKTIGFEHCEPFENEAPLVREVLSLRLERAPDSFTTFQMKTDAFEGVMCFYENGDHYGIQLPY